MRGILFDGVLVKGDVFSFVGRTGGLDQRFKEERQRDLDRKGDADFVIASLELETNMNSL